MAFVRWYLALLLFTSFGPPRLRAQERPCTRRTVAVGVVDYAWNLVTNLTAANFRGKLRGQDVQVISVVPDQSPRRIVMLLDASGSMVSAGQQWTDAKSISQSLIRFAPPRAHIALEAFAERIVDATEFEEDRTALLKSLDALVRVCEDPHRTPGRTALFDAISNARGLLGTPNAGDVIFALTDAGDNHSRTDPQKLQGELLGAGVRLFGVVIGPDLSVRARTPFEDPGQFDSIVRATGGNELTLRLGQAGKVLNIAPEIKGGSPGLTAQRLIAQVGEFYGLEVSLPEAVEKPTKWKLEVIDGNGKPMRGVEVHYPQELMPCKQASP